MEALGLGVGIVSLASIFQTCLHGYRTLNTAMAIGNAALTLNVQFRVEELRLYLWGRNWGLLTDLEPKSTNDVSDQRLEGAEGGKETVEVVREPVGPLDSVDEEFDIPGLRELTIEVLGRIFKALEDWKSLGERYGAASTEKSGVAVSESLSSKLLKEVSLRQAGKSKEITARNKFYSKLRWAMTDKSILEALLINLTSLNDSLEKLLPKRERNSLARGLAAELLNLLEEDRQSRADIDISEQLNQLHGLDEMKAARIIGLKQINHTEVGERRPDGTEKQSTPNESGPSPFAKPSIWAEGKHGSMHIPFKHFIRLAEPKVDYFHIDDAGQRWISERYAPIPRSKAVFSPPQSGSNVDLPSGSPAKVTLIEWRPTAHESRASELTEEDLEERRDHIARLLHRTSTTDVDFRVLDCMGYTTAPGHTPNGKIHNLVGYVYHYPDFASTKTLPITLRELLGEAYHSNESKIPPLEMRFKLARHLSIALYQLQCAGWVHRKISSYNVIFFRDRTTEEVILSQPYLVGWQYSRPDDQRRLFPSERASAGIADLDMYTHPRRLDISAYKPLPRYRKSFDIYSLGILLIEIAFWEPILALASAETREKMEKFEEVSSFALAKDWWKVIEKTAREELASEMGIAYRDAVLFCLRGAGLADAERFETKKDGLLMAGEIAARGRGGAYFQDDDWQEVGIERDFYWGVLKALDKFGM